MSEEEKIEGSKAEGAGHKEDNPQTTTNLTAAQASDQEPTEQKEASSPEQSIPELQTTNPKPQTTPMEVHHHGHVHEKKKWKEYVFQFFMLFLAVTLGFFVENQREHYIEGMREKQFIKSLVNDLRSDIVKLTSIIKIRTVRASDLDSLKLLVNSDSPNTHTNDIYYLASTAARTLTIRFIPNDGTMQQLKNSGAFRLIRNRIVSDSIATYDVNVRNALRQSEVEEMVINDYRQAAAKIFNTLIFDEIMDDNLNVIRRPHGNPALANYTSTELYNWNYKMYSMSGINRANRRDARLLLTQATNLLKTLQKEYHLENE
ncbi:MAG: hypothetical protein WKF85_15085 [Chitinophagaceae bacterium]